ncbi:unnamed protein product [Closterium sp. NIES-53]
MPSGCSPSPLAPSYASGAAADVPVSEDVRAASASARVAVVVEATSAVVEVAAGVVEGAAVEVGAAVGVVAGVVAGVGALVAVVEAAMGVAAAEAVGLVAVGLSLNVPVLVVASVSSSSVGARPYLHKSRIAIFDLDFDAILSAMYALSVSVEGDCYLCVPPDPGIAAATLGASESGTLPGTVPAEALHTFTLDSGASRCFFRDSTTLTPLAAPVPVRLADPSGGPVVARSSTVLPCPAVPSGSLSGLHLPSFSTNLTLLWHHRLGHPSLPHLRGMHSRLLRAAPHSSSFPPRTAPLQTLHMDVWGPVRVSGQSREHYFLLVVDDYTRYTTVFPLCRKGQVVDVLIPWIRTVHLQLRECFGQDLPVLRLQSDKGGEFSSNLLREFCRGEGIFQLFTLPDSPQQNGIAERRIGLVMEVARTSMIHAATPHFLWPFAVQYAAHQLNL